MSFRKNRITRPIFRWARTAMPKLSETEARAIEAGTVWWDGELFGGAPDWARLLAMQTSPLSPVERAFLDGPVEELCRMLDEWRIGAEHRDLPEPVWRFLKENRFFGMVIPTEYGGLGFSNAAHSDVVRKVSSASVVAGVTVMVPNSLGPGELMLHFGTDAQRNHWLPRLADGREIPCFALTSAEAGSDAASMRDRGVVAYGEHEGRRVLGVKLDFAKRYITLAPVATVMGLAFKLFDPDRLLGAEVERGITVALLPTSTPGVEKGERHLPLGTHFQNGPIRGENVFIPLDWILGGPERIGEGWSMLMTALAAGRGISLPSQSAAAIGLAGRVAGGYARIRTQFGQPIGRFEGIEEPLATITADLYQTDAARQLTVAALDEGHRPAVISAIMKLNATEMMRRSLTAAMDVLGGKAIAEGPNNPLAAHYRSIPIGITVEGANILTRNLMIFGQGAVRAHPYLLHEMRALADGDEERGLAAFDRAFWPHLGHALRNAARTALYGWTGGLAASAPRGAAFTSHWRQLSRYAATFALLADLAFLTLGGQLKRREMISARLGDVLSELYLLAATLRRFEGDGRPEADRPLVEFVMLRGINRMGHAVSGVLVNLPARWASILVRLLAFPLGIPARPPADELVSEVAGILQRPGSQRERLTADVYAGAGRPEHPVSIIDEALTLSVDAAPILLKLREAGHRDWDGTDGEGLLSADEKERLSRMRQAVDRAIAVDAFDAAELARGARATVDREARSRTAQAAE